MEIYIEKYGTALTVAQSTFVIHTEEGSQRISPEKASALHIGAHCRVSTEALLLAIEHNIEVFFMDGKGFPQARLWGNRFGSISTIRRKQLLFTRDKKAWKWICKVITNRIEGQMGVLMGFQETHSEINAEIDKAVSRLHKIKGKIESEKENSSEPLAPTLRGREGSASKIYFETMQILLPAHWQFKERSRRPATDPFNALLNYAYGILYQQVESACIIAGLDSCLGILHRDDYNRPALVYDMIESYRIWVEYVVVFLCRQDVFYPECFSFSEGGCWLEQDGRRLLIQACKDYLDEVITIKGLNRSRKIHIQQDAYALADEIMRMKDA